jgi:hypothetical protein
MITYISKILDKIAEISAPLTKIGREILYKNRDILVFSIGLVLYFHFFYQVMMEMIYNMDGILRWLDRLNPIGKGCLLLPCLLIFIVLIEFVIRFFTTNKKMARLPSINNAEFILIRTQPNNQNKETNSTSSNSNSPKSSKKISKFFTDSRS